MSRLSGLNSISVNGLINISADTVNTTTISNELNKLDNIDTNQTIQNQIDNLFRILIKCIYKFHI